MEPNFQILSDALNLNLGCGPVQPKGWINVDGSNRARLASQFSFLDNLLVKLKVIPPTEFNTSIKYFNLFKPLPYLDNSITCIYAGELWEHFEYPDAEKLTKECHRVLKVNGILRICVPDGPTFWKNYLEIFEKTMAMPRHKRDSKALRDHVQMYFNDICTRRKIFGSMGHTHKWQYDEVQLIEMLERNGFSGVERMKFHQSKIPGIENIERSEFLIVEGIKK